MRFVLVCVIMAFVIGVTIATPWGYWEACRHQYDRTAQLCVNDIQCGPDGHCDLRTGTCTFPGMEQDALNALACASGSSPHPLWSIPLLATPEVSLATSVGSLVITAQSPTGIPLLTGQNVACQADPLTLEPTDQPCRPEPHSYCGRRYGATGRCAHIGTRGICHSKVPPHSSACTGRGGISVPGSYNKCVWPQYHTQEECLNNMCHPRFQMKSKDTYICPIYCYDRQFTTKAHCLRHFKGRTILPMEGWDEMLGRCRVECHTCMKDFDKAHQHSATHLGTCTRSDVWVWHLPQYHDEVSCIQEGARHESVEDPPLSGEECPYLGLPSGEPCPSTVNITAVVMGCLLPYSEGRASPFMTVYASDNTAKHWLPDVTPSQCASLDTPGTWTTWTPPHRPATELAALLPKSMTSGAEWCNASLVTGQMPLSPLQQAARRQWIAASAVALVVSQVTVQDAGQWRHSAWTQQEGSWTEGGLPFSFYWAASPTNPVLLRMAVTLESEDIYMLNVTQGLDHQIPEAGAIPFICNPESSPGSSFIEGYGHCVRMFHNLGRWNATHVSKKKNDVSDHPTEEEAPKQTSPHKALQASPDTAASTGTTERYQSGGCPQPGYIWPECTERLCGKWTLEEAEEVRGITVNGQCQCNDAYWDGPECNHCAVPKLEAPHQYICAQVPPEMLPANTHIKFIRVPVPIYLIDSWVQGINGIRGFPGLKNYPAGTMGFDCKCRHYRKEYDQRHSNQEEMHQYHERRGVTREVPPSLYARALPLNETERNITSACLQLAGVDQTTEDAIIALLAGETPAGIECRRSLSSGTYLLLIVVCVLLLVGLFLILSNMCSRETAANYKDEIMDENVMLEDEKHNIKSAVTIASSSYRPSARKRFVPTSASHESD